MRRRGAAALVLIVGLIPAAAFAKSVTARRPPRGVYRFDGFNEQVGPDRPGGAPGSITVNHARTRVSKASFTLKAFGSATPCIAHEPTSGTVLVKVKGSFPITAGRGEDRGQWVVGVNGNGVRGRRATFTIGNQAPMVGTFALFFYDAPPEAVTFVAKFSRCTINTGNFGR
jgi:hypothetical protein